MKLYAPFVENRTRRPIACEPHHSDRLPLTERELEALRWTMEGKTAWEVGSILGISEQTAVRHLSNATRKLGSVNKHHAVVTAMRLGLLK
jgi:DNA-binding CsgD family transcriptional regulator